MALEEDGIWDDYQIYVCIVMLASGIIKERLQKELTVQK